MKTIANRLLTCLGIHLLFLELLVSAAKKKPRDYSPAIYYGDSDVYIGNPFSITCIISISDPIDWLKDGESIKNHNLRHGKDVHAFFISEHPIEADVTSIEDDDIVGGISLKPYITTSLPGGRKFHDDGHGVVDPLNLNRDINLYTKRPQQQQSTLSSSSLSPSSSYSSTATTKLLLPSPSSTATTTTTGRKHHLDDLVSVTSSIIDINRMDSDVSNPINDKRTILVYNIYKNLTLNCDLPQIGDRKIIWEKNGTDINSIETLKGRHKIKENKFIIDKTNLDDAGLYSCSIKDSPSERREFHAYAQVEVRVPSNVGVVEGETLKIQCSVIGTLPYITWEHENLTINSTYERYALTENDGGIKNAVLEIRNISLSDRGEYKCVGRNEGAESISKPAEDTSYIRVKGKLAALWPFLGICAEVFVLCAIILIYEKKRNKTDLDESDTDPNTEQEKLKTQRN